MAFLDNSGDIILDAVLTEVGRRRLTSGQGLTITKFALGDDEINYSQYDKNHASGSAYYDLEILQTPVFEASTQLNANINYGLLTFTRKDILYMPMWKQNNTVNGAKFASTHQGLYYIAANEQTAQALKKYPFAAKLEKVITAGSTNEHGIAYELGLDTSELPKTQNNRAVYINQMGTNDTRFSLSANSLFVSSVMGFAGQTPTYKNNLTTNTLSSFPTPQNFKIYANGVPSRNKRNYVNFNQIRKSNVQIFVPNNASTSTNLHSVISGPSSALFMFNIGIQSTLATIVGGQVDKRYVDYGKTNQSALQTFGTTDASGYKYDFIDTAVDIVARTTGATISVPIRILRRRT